MNTSPNALTSLIQKEIASHGEHLSFAQFMEMALFYPKLGYYQSPTFALGRAGDFTTAPEISPLFARCFAAQFLQVFDEIGTQNVLEIGAGSGRFAADVLQTLLKANRTTHYYIYELSEHLREKQRQFLQNTHPTFLKHITWLDQLPKSFTGIIFANEVLDVLPVHCFSIEEEDISERFVTYHHDHFAWIKTRASGELRKNIELLRTLYDLPSGYQSEINLQLSSFIQALSETLVQGVIFLVDYGYGQREYYHPERMKGTLTCFYQHHQHADPFQHVGKQDITAHVDFTRVIDIASENGFDLAGFTTQTAFLLSCGLMELAQEEEKNLSEMDALQSHQAIKLLTLPTEMGERIKVMALSKDTDAPLLGFKLQDRRRDL